MRRSATEADLQITLAPEPISARRARQFVLDTLHRLGEERHVDLAVLLVSELATNAVLHARTPLLVSVAQLRGGIRVEVSDRSAAAATPRNFAPDATTGRGLELVSALSKAWGTRTTDEGKCVWFELEDEA